MAGKRKKTFFGFNVKRDTAIISFAIIMGAFEILFGGGRASVFTFLTAVFLSPIVIRADEGNKDEKES